MSIEMWVAMEIIGLRFAHEYTQDYCQMMFSVRIKQCSGKNPEQNRWQKGVRG